MIVYPVLITARNFEGRERKSHSCFTKSQKNLEILKVRSAIQLLKKEGLNHENIFRYFFFIQIIPIISPGGYVTMRPVLTSAPAAFFEQQG